jgi:hypothetical protein
LKSDCPLACLIGLTSTPDPLVAKLLEFARLGPLQRNAARQAVADGAQQREVGRRLAIGQSHRRKPRHHIKQRHEAVIVNFHFPSARSVHVLSVSVARSETSNGATPLRILMVRARSPFMSYVRNVGGLRRSFA